MDQKPEFEFKLTTTNNDFKKAFLLTEIVFYTQKREREKLYSQVLTTILICQMLIC